MSLSVASQPHTDNTSPVRLAWRGDIAVLLEAAARLPVPCWRRFLQWLAAPPNRLHNSVGMTITEDVQVADPGGPSGRVDVCLRRGWPGQGRCP